jgi:hypothetical protein
MRGLSRDANGHHPIGRESQETVGVLGTWLVRRKTDENLGPATDQE